MKVKLGNTYVRLPKDTVASHMANLLTTRSIFLNKDKDFKTSFIKNKELCLIFLRHNRNFVYSLVDNDWLEEILKFKTTQHELLMQEIVFKFSDNSEWSISLNDIANLKIITDHVGKNRKDELLNNPVELAEWAQQNLTWNQIKDFAILRKMEASHDLYQKEWFSTNKRVVQYKYEKD